MEKKHFEETDFLLAIRKMLKSTTSTNITEEKLQSLTIEYSSQTNYASQFPTVLCLWDFKNETYAHISDNVNDVFGDPPSDFLKDGFSHSLKYFPENHREIFIKNILPSIGNQLSIHLDTEEIKMIRFSYTTKLHVYENQSRWFLHQLSVIETHNGLPVLGLKILSDIHHIKKDDQIDFIITTKTKNGKFETLMNTTYNTSEQTLKLSTREKEILALIANGYSSKQISSELNISENTVNNHRKNMLDKTKTLNSHNLVKLAIQENLI